MGATALPPRMNKIVATRQASPRQLSFGNSALAVGCGQTLELQPGSKSRSGHRVDEAVALARFRNPGEPTVARAEQSEIGANEERR